MLRLESGTSYLEISSKCLEYNIYKLYIYLVANFANHRSCQHGENTTTILSAQQMSGRFLNNWISQLTTSAREPVSSNHGYRGTVKLGHHPGVETIKKQRNHMKPPTDWR